MALSVKIITPPAIEPVSVDEAKRHLRVDWPDDDGDIAEYISSARQWLERKLNRAFITQTLRATFDLPNMQSAYGIVGGIVGKAPRLAFDLPYSPLLSVTTVEMETDVEVWTTLTLDNPPGVVGDYRVDSDSEPARVWLHASSLFITFSSWDWIGVHIPRIRITYTAGYGATASTVPSPIRNAIKRATAHLYENREAAGTIPETVLPSEYMIWDI